MDQLVEAGGPPPQPRTHHKAVTRPAHDRVKSGPGAHLIKVAFFLAVLILRSGNGDVRIGLTDKRPDYATAGSMDHSDEIGRVTRSEGVILLIPTPRQRTAFDGIAACCSPTSLDTN